MRSVRVRAGTANKGNKGGLVDTGKEYIEMCEDADVEIQSFSSNHFGEHEFWGNSEKDNENQIWLPRQDQLQDMMWNKNAECEYVTQEEVDSDYFCLMQQPFTYLDDLVMDNVPVHSMEQLWLAFVMSEKFNKIWDGKYWVIKE